MTPDCTSHVTTVVDMNDYLALEAERDEALQQRDEAVQHAHDMEADMAETRLRADLEFTRLRALLREVEWGASCQGDEDLCHVCQGMRPDKNPGPFRHRGHAPDCRLKAALEGQ
jgi:hypothetical protein